MTPGLGRDREDGPRFRRFLVVFDPAFENLGALDAVALLAGRLEAELAALFVEDSDLLRLAGHPVAGSVSRLSGGRQLLDEDILRRALKVQAATTRSALEGAAERHRVKTSFEIRRGRLTAEVLASSEGADLVVVDWACGDLLLRAAAGGRRTQPSAAARDIAEAAGRPVLLLRQGAPLGGPVLVAYDGSDEADKALAIALAIAGEESGDLEVVFLTRSLALAAVWQEDISERLAGRALHPAYLQMPHAGLEDLFREARRRHVSLLVLEAGLPFLAGQATGDLLARMDCSVLLVR
ncbi:MAG: hypothetical protein H7841_10585 [Magnetospirillum sp. WYHS-4]